MKLEVYLRHLMLTAIEKSYARSFWKMKRSQLKAEEESKLEDQNSDRSSSSVLTSDFDEEDEDVRTISSRSSDYMSATKSPRKVPKIHYMDSSS
jgi:hypothetical protein